MFVYMPESLCLAFADHQGQLDSMILIFSWFSYESLGDKFQFYNNVKGYYSHPTIAAENFLKSTND